jgi:anti-anti-sigma regulatory factor
MYAPQLAPAPAPIVLRLIGFLDGDLVDAFRILERGLVGADGGTVIVDVRSLEVLGEPMMAQLAAVVGEARARGRDVRLDARGVQWRRIAKSRIAGQPPVDAQLRADARRTVILAHSNLRPHN